MIFRKSLSAFASAAARFAFGYWLRARKKAALAPVLFVLAIPVAFAVDPYPPILCNGLFGCGAEPSDVFTESTLPTVAKFLIQLAAGGAVLAVVIGGVKMVTSYGDEGQIGNARKAILYALGGLALALTATSIVSFVTTENYGQGGGGDFLFGAGGVMASVIRIVMVLFNVAIAIVTILAGMRMVMSLGSADEFKKGGDIIKWAIVGAVIVNLAKAGIQAFLALNL